MRLLCGGDLLRLLDGERPAVIERVRRAYVAHARGATVVPHSSFLRFPDRPSERMIALPGYLRDGSEVAGLKWIASFPGNVALGAERASAVIVLNSMRDGRASAILEGSVVSAQRTAASAALAAGVLHGPPSAVGIVGCGAIAHQVLRFLEPDGGFEVALFDRSAAAAERFAAVAAATRPELRTRIAPALDQVLAECDLVVLATTAAEPHVRALPVRRSRTSILHLSLRDLAPEIILESDNVVDDLDHVSRERTSIHLASLRADPSRFVRCSLGDVLCGKAPPRADGPEGRPLIFSPFGLGALDLAVAQLALELAEAKGIGVRVPEFVPPPWHSGPEA